MRATRIATMTLLGLWAMALAGCSSGVETSYGRSRGRSVNGTEILADLLRRRGHEVRRAFRLTDELDEWADVIVRFAPRPGPPDREEAAWYEGWMGVRDGRRLIYVPRDFDAQAEYWSHVLDALPAGADATPRDRAASLRDKAKGWADHLPSATKTPANPNDWFAEEAPKGPPEVCKTLGGPWASGVDPASASLWRHATPRVESETVLLSGDGRPLAIEWTRYNGSKVLVVANGSFLLNAALLNRARWPLADRVAAWAGDDPTRVAFVEGGAVLGEDQGPTIFSLLKVPPFGWVAAQMLALGLAACLARAPRLGRARPDPPSGEDRPVAHPEALGALLARTGQAADARAILDAYRRWRHPSRPARADHPSPIEEPSSPSGSPQNE